jgi:hypothetical protein
VGGRPGPGSCPWGQLCRLAGAAFGVAVTLMAPPTAGAQDLGYTASLFAARTTVPGTAIDGVYVFNSVDAGRGPVRVTFSVPWIRNRSVTEASIDPLDGSAIAATDTTTTGFGDPLLRVDARIIHRPDAALQVGLTGAAKLPTVDPDTGRGTGEFDGAIGVSVYKGFGPTSFLVDALYWRYGDPDTIDFDDSLSYSVAMARTLGASSRWSTMVSLSGFSAGYNGLAAPAQVNVAMLRLLGRRQSLSVSASVGLTESATDYSIGTSWRVTR